MERFELSGILLGLQNGCSGLPPPALPWSWVAEVLVLTRGITARTSPFPSSHLPAQRPQLEARRAAGVVQSCCVGLRRAPSWKAVSEYCGHLLPSSDGHPLPLQLSSPLPLSQELSVIHFLLSQDLSVGPWSDMKLGGNDGFTGCSHTWW